MLSCICFLLNLLISTCSEVHPRDSDEDLVSPQLPQDPRTRRPALHPQRNGYDQKRPPSDNSTPSVTPNQPVHSMHLGDGWRRRYGTIIFNFYTLHMELRQRVVLLPTALLAYKTIIRKDFISCLKSHYLSWYN